MFQEKSRKYRNHGDVGINEKGNGGEREKRCEQQQKIIEEFLEANFRRRGQRWEQILKQKDEEWKKEIQRRERELMQRLDTKIKTFYNEQLKRDEDVLSFLEKREEKMEASMLQKAEGL